MLQVHSDVSSYLRKDHSKCYQDNREYINIVHQKTGRFDGTFVKSYIVQMTVV